VISASPPTFNVPFGIPIISAGFEVIAVMIRDYCGRVEVEIVEPDAPATDSQKATKTKKKK
jgi:hypothetical protein